MKIFRFPEIAEHAGITRQGVRDSIKRAEHALHEMEDKLGLVARYGDTERCAEELQHEVEQLHELNAAQLHSAEADEIVSPHDGTARTAQAGGLTWHLKGLPKKFHLLLSTCAARGRLTESDIKDAMKEIRMALLEADVNFKVAKDFIKTVTEKATDAEILESLSPTQQVIKIVNEELVSPWAARPPFDHIAEPAHHRDDGRSAGRRQNHQLRKVGRSASASSSSAPTAARSL